MKCRIIVPIFVYLTKTFVFILQSINHLTSGYIAAYRTFKKFSQFPCSTFLFKTGQLPVLQS